MYGLKRGIRGNRWKSRGYLASKSSFRKRFLRPARYWGGGALQGEKARTGWKHGYGFKRKRYFKRNLRYA